MKGFARGAQTCQHSECFLFHHEESKLALLPAVPDETRRDKNTNTEWKQMAQLITQFKFLNCINCNSGVSVQFSSEQEENKKNSLKKLILSESTASQP